MLSALTKSGYINSDAEWFCLLSDAVPEGCSQLQAYWCSEAVCWIVLWPSCACHRVLYRFRKVYQAALNGPQNHYSSRIIEKAAALCQKSGGTGSESPICSLTSYVRWIIYKSKIDAIGKCMEGQSCVLSSSMAHQISLHNAFSYKQGSIFFSRCSCRRAIFGRGASVQNHLVVVRSSKIKQSMSLFQLYLYWSLEQRNSCIDQEVTTLVFFFFKFP